MKLLSFSNSSVFGCTHDQFTFKRIVLSYGLPIVQLYGRSWNGCNVNL